MERIVVLVGATSTKAWHATRRSGSVPSASAARCKTTAAPSSPLIAARITGSDQMSYGRSSSSPSRLSMSEIPCIRPAWKLVPAISTNTSRFRAGASRLACATRPRATSPTTSLGAALATSLKIFSPILRSRRSRTDSRSSVFPCGSQPAGVASSAANKTSSETFPGSVKAIRTTTCA